MWQTDLLACACAACCLAARAQRAHAHAVPRVARLARRGSRLTALEGDALFFVLLLLLLLLLCVCVLLCGHFPARFRNRPSAVCGDICGRIGKLFMGIIDNEKSPPQRHARRIKFPFTHTAQPGLPPG